MSVYNKEKAIYLKDCLESLVSQTVPPTEVVIVQDGPISEDLLSVIDEFKDRLSVQSLKLDHNIGLARALNAGIPRCKYDLIARMDSDDIALPKRFETQLMLMSDETVDVCSGVIEEWDANFERQISTRHLPLVHHEIVNFARSRSPISHPAAMYKKKAILAVGGYVDVYPEDHLLWVKLIQNGARFSNSRETLVKMRTGDMFFKRRGLKFLKGQIYTFKYMKDTGFISNLKFLQLTIMYSALRMSPGWLKLLLYKVAR